jgi:hypothetical protein
MSQAKLIEVNFRELRQQLAGGGLPPDNRDMEARVTKLEALAEKTSAQLLSIDKDLAILKVQMDGVSKHYATKADVAEARSSIIMWVVSAILLAQLLPALLKKFGL